MAEDDETAPVKETNFYKHSLAEAKIAIQSEIDGFSGIGGPEATITRHVATNGGWECDEADTWAQDVSSECTGIVTVFQSAKDDVDGAWSSQPTQVPEGDWRGLSYRGR